MDKQTKKSVGRLSAYHDVFNSRQGQVVLYDLMKVHGMLAPNFPTDGNANELIYREGARSVVLRILTLLKTAPQQLLERIKNESTNEE